MASPAPDKSMDRRSWHRRASRPVSYWILALVVVILIHPLIPQFRWLMVHMVTLGLVTTSILVWGQHFTEALLKTRLGEESRPTQVRRIQILTASTVVTMIGMVATWPWVTVVGALGVSAVMIWYAYALGTQIKAALAPRFAFVVRSYLIAALLLPVGAVLGSILAFSPGEPWQGRLLLAHQIVNVLGFVGVTATATLLTLWPTVLRTKLDGTKATRASRSLVLMIIGVLLAVLGALVNNVLIGAAAIVVYLLGQLSIMLLLAELARRAATHKRREPLPLFPILSLAAAAFWFVGSTIALLSLWISAVGAPAGQAAASPLNFSILATDVQELTVPFVVGFLLQLLLGAMSFLMPTAMGGGPRALRASLQVMSTGAVFRVVVLNLTLALFSLASVDATLGAGLFGFVTFGTLAPAQFGSVSRVMASLVAFLVLVSFVVLLMKMIKVNVRERKAFQQRVSLGMPTAGAPAVLAAGPTSQEDEPVDGASGNVNRRHLTSAMLGIGSVLGATALGRAFDGTLGAPAAGVGSSPTPSAADVTPTGEVTAANVKMTADMRFVPDTIEVPAGNTLEIRLENTDATNVHDLVLETGETTGRIQPHDTATLTTGVIGTNVEGWCSIVGHRSMGMELHIVATGSAAQVASTGTDGAAGAGPDPLARVASDFAKKPGASRTTRDPRLPAVGANPQNHTFTVTEHQLEIAPGIAMESMTYNGQVMGPTIVSEVGGKVNLKLVNKGTMGHSIDFHAGTVSPSTYMRTIAPGEELDYPFTTDFAGMWLYHCSTAPMTVHLSSGMYGALIVPPPALAKADREYVLVQSEHYLTPEASVTDSGEKVEGPDGCAVHTVSPEKIFAERPDFTVFNGHATQYQNEPLVAKVGERVRIWVLAAGPSKGISFHVVGTIFDTVFKEGTYVLRPDNDTGGGAQAIDLSACQGGFVEMTFREPGTYKAVNHNFSDLERGALAFINVTE